MRSGGSLTALLLLASSGGCSGERPLAGVDRASSAREALTVEASVDCAVEPYRTSCGAGQMRSGPGSRRERETREDAPRAC